MSNDSEVSLAEELTLAAELHRAVELKQHSGLNQDDEVSIATGNAAAAEASETTSFVAAIVPDQVLLASTEIAREALAEITVASSIGTFSGHELHEDHVVTLFFECLLPGYPGWRWAATLARVDEMSPVNVLEVELLPGEGAVVAPDWVPWSLRLAQYRETQTRHATEETAAAEAAAAELSEEDDVLAEDDLLENDYSDFDDEIDGVDVDGIEVDGEDAQFVHADEDSEEAGFGADGIVDNSEEE